MKAKMDRRVFLAGAGGVGLSACGNPPAISALDRFRNGFSGKLIARDDAGFDKWREGLLWQMDVPERRPDLIVRPHSADAVAKALRYANDAGLKVAIKSGGHNIAASFMRDSGMLIDLAEFGGVSPIVDTDECWVEPAAWSWTLAQTIEPLGLSFPYAHCATVPMGGYLLGGGVGVNGDAWGGIGCHAVTAVKIMLPDGDVVIADEHQHSDLFWAARGGGTGFFGVVLAFKVRLFPRANEIHERVLLYPVDAAPEVARWLESMAARSPKNIEYLVLLAHRPPPLQGASAADKKMCIARLAAFGEKEGDAGRALRAVEDAAPPPGALFPPLDKMVTMKDVLIGSVDPYAGLGFGRYSVDTVWTQDLATTIAATIPDFINTTSPKTHILATPRHGAKLHDDAAFSSLASSFLGVYSVWDDAQHDQANVEWTQKLANTLNPYARGRYINELDAFAFPDRLEACFSADAISRLGNLRADYDSGGLFHGFPGN